MAGEAGPHPHIVVAPGPEGAAVSWQYRCDGCGEQQLVATVDEARELADRHNADRHGGAGSIDVTSIGAV
jgi:hypothetical protein